MLLFPARAMEGDLTITAPQVVDLAKREATVEATLEEIESVWRTLDFDWEVRTVFGPQWAPDAEANGFPGGLKVNLCHQETHLQLIRNGRDVAQVLEDQLVTLHTLSSTESARVFHVSIAAWRSRLEAAASVLRAWLEVQRRGLLHVIDTLS